MNSSDHDLLGTDPTGDDFMPNWEIIQLLQLKSGEGEEFIDEAMRSVVTERIVQLATELASTRASISKLKLAVLFAITQTHYGSSHGGLSERECVMIHSKLLTDCAVMLTKPNAIQV